MKYRLILTLGILALFVGAIPSHAQWSTDPTVNNAICTAMSAQYSPTIVSDGAGGDIITWYDYRSGGYSDIYAQRINAAGVVQWTADGVAVCTAAYSQHSPTIVSDGAGGAIITWQDYRGGIGYSDIYAQRINAAGSVQWAANGVAICTARYYQYSQSIISDGAGGAIITWKDDPYGRSDIYAQRINAAGVVQWTTDGVAICSARNSQDYPTIVSDRVGGAIIAWSDFRSGITNDIYAQRINASGVVQWTSDGVGVCTGRNLNIDPKIINDGIGGAIITWKHQSDIYAQRINAAGEVQWITDGVAICTATSDQRGQTIVSDDAGGAIITWQDLRSGGSGYGDIYAQRVNAAGVVQWTTDGVAICAAINEQFFPTIVSDDADGAIISWQDHRRNGSGNFFDIYAQRINAAGVMQWTTDGVAICTEKNTPYKSAMISDDAGGAIITWYELCSSSSWDIYAQRVRSDGTLGGNQPPLANASADQTIIVNETVQLDGSGSSDPDGDPITYSWEITSKPAGSDASLSDPIIVNPTFIADVAGEYRVSLVVNDGFVNSTPDEVIITAITAQEAIGSLIDQINALVASGDLEANQAKVLTDKLTAIIGLLDNGKTEVAINQLETFINMVNADINSGKLTLEQGQPLIDAANAIIAALTNPQLAKAGFQADASDGITAVDQNKVPLLTGFQLEQNYPNPFNPVTTIQFSIPHESYVRLKVYNAFGAEVATLVDQRVAAGTYKVNWNASHLATGFYFSRLEAEGFTQTKKMLLMK